MAKRKIIKIDEEKCNGCGECIPNCPEGALRVIDGKVRLISDLFCDGLGACIGHCPQGAIAIEEREAQRYDERKVMANVVKQGANVIKAHLHHLKDHGQMEYFKEAMDYLRENNIKVNEEAGGKTHQGCPGSAVKAQGGGCPGSRVMDFSAGRKDIGAKEDKGMVSAASQLRQWPVQLMLVPPYAPYLNNADILIAADCVPFAYAAFHEELLKGKMLLVGCPKLDDTQVYQQKITQVLEHNNVKSITYAHMEVPCCFGLIGIIQDAIAASGKDVPFHDVTISVQGEKFS